MIDRLPKHHLGFVVAADDLPAIEQRVGKSFHLDALQGTRVLFDFDEHLHIYIEYICKEGRAANLPLGFAHICYTIADTAELEKVTDYIAREKLGYRVTKLEKSGSEECGHITFYYIKNHGVVEFNVVDCS